MAAATAAAAASALVVGAGGRGDWRSVCCVAFSPEWTPPQLLFLFFLFFLECVCPPLNAVFLHLLYVYTLIDNIMVYLYAMMHRLYSTKKMMHDLLILYKN